MVTTKRGQKKISSSRRSFLGKIWAGLGIVVLMQLMAGALAFLRSGSREEPTSEKQPVAAGLISDFPAESMTYIPAAHCYLSRLKNGAFLAISRKCTHLGCAVPWNGERQQFECPCHRSVFDRLGNVLKSPAPRALDLYPVTFEQQAVVIEVSKTIKRASFQQAQLAFPENRG